MNGVKRLAAPHDGATRELRAFLADAMATCGDGRVLVVSPWDLGPLTAETVQVADPSGLDGLPAGGREYALALAAGVLEHLAPDEGGTLLATLRDLRARQVLAAVPAVASPHHRSVWTLERMLSHGLEARATVGTGAGALAVYGFHIDRYKKTPDWLNARHWANPEHWNRFRW